MNDTPTRRWYQCGLGTLFMAITLLAVWLSWELDYIRERRETRNEVEAKHIQFLFAHPKQSIPFWRVWLGDEPVDCISVLSSDRDQVMRIKRLFPEAETEGYVTHLEPSRSPMPEIQKLECSPPNSSVAPTE
jgi:hypothetical protein